MTWTVSTNTRFNCRSHDVLPGGDSDLTCTQCGARWGLGPDAWEEDAGRGRLAP